MARQEKDKRNNRCMWVAGAILGFAAPCLAQAPSRPSPPPIEIQAAPDHPGYSVDRRSGCWVWNDDPQPVEAVTWTGGCDASGRASGRGTVEWHVDGKLFQTITGEFRNGDVSGVAIVIDEDRNRYEGKSRGGRYNGRGVLTFTDGRRYEGEFQNGDLQGDGVLTTADGLRYEGEFRKSEFDGRGVLTDKDGGRYDGEFRESKKHGRGVIRYANGDRYDGEFRDDKRHGRGVYVSADGTRRDGQWREGEFVDPASQQREAPRVKVPAVTAGAPPYEGRPVSQGPREEQSANVAIGKIAAPPPTAPMEVMFLARGEALLKDGDFAAARLFFQRSVARGNPLGALGMGKTYDPVFFARIGIIGARGDRKVAGEWYRQAADAGIVEAGDRLRQLGLD